MKHPLAAFVCTLLTVASLITIAACGEKPPEEGGTAGPSGGGSSSGCNWYAGGRLSLGEQRCYNGQLYQCTSSGLQGMGMGGSHPSCR